LQAEEQVFVAEEKSSIGASEDALTVNAMTFHGFIEPEIFGIGIVYSLQIGGKGHWSVPVPESNIKAYADRFLQQRNESSRNKSTFIPIQISSHYAGF